MEEGFDAGYVSGDVYADGVVGDFSNADFPAVFEPAELLKLLDFFEGAWRESRIFEEGVALKNVEAEMLEVAGLDGAAGVADPGDGGAGEVKGVVVEIEDGLDDVGIHDIGRNFDGRGDGGDSGGGFLEKRADGRVDNFRVEEGFVALHVDEDLAPGVGCNFCDALGSSAMVGAGHAGFAAEGLHCFNDAVVIGGHDDAGGELGKLGSFVDALNHGSAGEGDQRLAREAGGTVARGDYDDDFGGSHRGVAPVVVLG